MGKISRVFFRITFVFVLSIFLTNPTVAVSSHLSDYPQFQIIGDLDQYIDGRKIMTRCEESILSYQNIKATQMIYHESILELRNLSIANNSKEDIYVSFREFANRDGSFAIFDTNWESIEQPIFVPGFSISERLNIKTTIKQSSCYKNSLHTVVFAAYQVDQEGELLTQENRIEFSILCKQESEYLECQECTIDHGSSYWSTLSKAEYSTNYIPRDGNISYSERLESYASPYGESLAVGGNRMHSVWIEKSEVDIRNVYYSYADLPANNCNRWSIPINVTGFKNEDIQVENVVIGSKYDKAFIIVNVEINNGDDPFETEHKDDHVLFCIVVNNDDPCNFYTLNGENEQLKYIPPKTKNGVLKCFANISQNIESDTWHPTISVDPEGRPHIAWQAYVKFSRTKFTHINKSSIYWIYFDGGWKTIHRNDSGLPAPYVYSENDDCNAIVVTDANYEYSKPSVDTVRFAFDSVIYLAIGIIKNGRPIILKRYYDSTDNTWGNLYTEKKDDPEFSGNTEISISQFGQAGNMPCKTYYTTIKEGLLYGNLKTPKFPDCKSISVVVSRCYYFCFHSVFEVNGEIYYYVFLGGGKGIIGPVNISNNSGYSHSPSIALDDKFHPHITWTDETPFDKSEIVYCGLRCSP